MSGISPVGRISSSYSPYSTISAGGKLQSAAQDAAGLAIEEKTETQTRGLDQGTENLKDAKSALNIQDGAMDGITDYVQRIKELAVQSKNGTLNDEDRSYIQSQIDEYIKGIDDIANSTSFNEKKLLDGSEPNMNIVSDAEGGSTTVNTHDSTAKALGLEEFDVTKGDADLNVVDNALKTLQDMRTTTGSQTNGIEHAINYNSKASLELNGFSMDKEEDRSLKALQELKSKQALDQYQGFLQKMQQEDEEKKNLMLFA